MCVFREIMMTTSIFISLAPISLAQDFPLLVNYLRQKLQEMGVKGCSLLVWCCQTGFLQGSVSVLHPELEQCGGACSQLLLCCGKGNLSSSLLIISL